MEEQLIGRIPPHSIEAEESVLGAMIVDKTAINDATELLKAGDFYREANGQIFDGIVSIFMRSEPVDLITLSEELRQNGLIDQIGGVSYLAKLSSSVATTANIRYYCKIVEEKSLLRKLIRSSNEIMGKAYEDAEDVNVIMEQAEKNIFDISQGVEKEGFSPINEVLLSSFERIEEMAANKGQLSGLTTGFIDLDHNLSGLQRSDLVLLAARPSMGKTALGINMALNAALKADANVAIFSLEMSKEQLVQRMIASTSHVDLGKIISGNLDEDQWVQIINSMAPLSEANIYIDDTAGISLMELSAKCRRLKLEKGLDMIMIDYLQLMEMEGRSENRQQEISAISRGLKILAMEMDCPVIALSQLSRTPEMRADHRPILSDLRESGAIEQDADVVMFLYRDEYYHEDSEKKNIAELIISKHRNGPTGTIELVWKSEFTKFLNKENYYNESPN